MRRRDTVGPQREVPRYLVLTEPDAAAVVELLEGLDQLLERGGLDASQLLHLTRGRPVPGDDVAVRLQSVVRDAVTLVRSAVV